MYDKNLPLKVDCDASQYGLGAVLSHVYTDKSEKPIAYASRTLTKSDINYSQVDKEGASIIFALKKFNQYLLGNHFILKTDNKAIKKILDSKTEIGPIAAGRLVRWSLILSQYDYELEYRSTKKYCNADMLSRLPRTVKSELPVDNMIYSLQIDTLPITSDEIKAETLNDHVLKSVLEFLQNGKWPDKITDDIKPYSNKRNELSIEEGIILWGLRVVIPVKFRNKVLEELHQNHPGNSRMKSLSRIHIWFPNIDKEIENIVKSCKNCEKDSNEPNKIKYTRIRYAMKILPKMKILRLQPSNTFKMAYLMIKNFKWLTGLSSHILDIRLIHGNMHFICYIYILPVLS